MTLCWRRWESGLPRDRGRKDGAASPTRARASLGGAACTEPRAREPPGCVLRAAPGQVGLTHRTEPPEMGPVRPTGAGWPGVLRRADRDRDFHARRQERPGLHQAPVVSFTPRDDGPCGTGAGNKSGGSPICSGKTRLGPQQRTVTVGTEGGSCPSEY